MNADDQQRFFAKISPEPNSGCWLWDATTSRQGYARLSVGGRGGRMEYAHRLAFVTFVGPIPEGKEPDHKCRTRCCVNPDHLEPVEHKENMHRSPAVPWKARPDWDTVCAHGHPKTPETVYEKPDGSRECRTCRNMHARNSHRRARMACQSA